MACDIWWHYSKPVGSIGQYLVTEELIPDSSGFSFWVGDSCLSNTIIATCTQYCKIANLKSKGIL